MAATILGRWPPDRLARTRDLEIVAAMAILGVDEHRCLGFEDGTLADRADAEGVGLVGELIEEIDADTIVTFGPEGSNSDRREQSPTACRSWRSTG